MAVSQISKDWFTQGRPVALHSGTQRFRSKNERLRIAEEASLPKEYQRLENEKRYQEKE